MKLRIKGNSLRIRIQQQELLALVKHGHLSDAISFGLAPDQRLVFKLALSTEATTTRAYFEKNCISVSLPQSAIEELVTTDRVGINAEQMIDHNTSLSILVEKDFKCLTPREEDFDAFPHPEENHGHSC